MSISDDGQRVFFESKDSLVAADTNDGVQDVYEWHDGRIDLISSGTGSNDVQLAGASRSGRDVLFATNERLLGRDTDSNVDLYDARIGGGFAEPSQASAPCDLNGGGCEGSASSAPAPAGAGSAVFAGPGNQVQRRKASRRCPKGKRRVRRKGKARCVKRRRHVKHQRRKNRTANRNRRASR
jgi:hypothetical protein